MQRAKNVAAGVDGIWWIGGFLGFFFPFLFFLFYRFSRQHKCNLSHMLYKGSERRGEVYEYYHKKSKAVEYESVFDYYIIAFLPPRSGVNKIQQELSSLQYWLKKSISCIDIFIRFKGFYATECYFTSLTFLSCFWA